MLLSAHQPAYLPWPGLLDKVRQADVFVILDTVQRSHGDWSNRNRVKTQNGVQWLTVPVVGPRGQRFHEAKIEVNRGWRRKHWRTLELAYEKAPFWLTYALAIYGFYDYPWQFLVDLDERCLRWFCGELGIDTQIVRASHLVGMNGVKNGLLIALCQTAGADSFLFGAQGRDYADLEAFEKAGVEPLFQEYEPKVYEQLHGGFVPGLSALDMLLCVGPEKAKALL